LPGLPPGEVQMDIVFCESLIDPPIQTSIPGINRNQLWTVSKELSLAWKLLWLEIDSYPQGKDLYDVTILAEDVHLPFNLLLQVLINNDEWQMRNSSIQNFERQSNFIWKPDIKDSSWNNFQQEYPSIKGTLEDWILRVNIALNSVFSKINLFYK
jgi:Nucleotidyl transferase AbiEii toxin, Type IV TA system